MCSTDGLEQDQAQKHIFGICSYTLIRIHFPLCLFCCHYKGNKGGVSARMTVFGHPVCFLNCHLPAHMRNLEQRMEDFESILQQQQFDGGAATGVLDHEWVSAILQMFLAVCFKHFR